MQQPADALQSDGNGVDRSAGAAGGRPRGATKFVYASGSQPLDGYTIKRGIGAGGFGEVYYATSDAGKDVALKHIQRNLDVELRGVKQCLNLKHPNLLSLYDIKYDEEGQAWVVMEYVAGESLQDVIDRNPNGLPIDQAQGWFQGIAAGLAYLHDHGIVHRDLKPGNIFLDEGVVKIGDYGLSKFISCSRRSGQTESVGTFHYMAPEIGRGRYGKEIDIYALGIILYEMLTGHVPYEGESSQEIIMKHLTAQPRMECVPQAFRAVILKALAKDPGQRLRSVPQMRGEMPSMPGGPRMGSGFETGVEPDSPVITAEVVRGPRGNARPTEVPYGGSAAAPPAPSGSVATADSLPEEPIARAVCEFWGRLCRGWHSASLGAAPKAIILLLLIFGLLTNFAWLFTFGGAAAIVYLVYLVIRGLVLEPARPARSGVPAAPIPEPVARPEKPTQPARRVRVHRRSWQELAREELGGKSPRVRLTELTGSLLMAVVACVVLCPVMDMFVMILSGSESLEPPLALAPRYAWMVLASILGAWGILVCSKLWEGSQDEPSLRRFTMLALGLGVGAAAYFLADFMMLEPTYLDDAPRSFHNYPTALYNDNGIPNVLGYLGYFAGLFVVLRWWKQADPLRAVRLNIWSIFLCVLWAVILFFVLPFPRGYMVAATISIAVQLSAPWMPYRERKRLRRAGQEV